MPSRRRPQPQAQADPALPPAGVLLVDDDGARVYCHVCGTGWRNLAAHVKHRHGLSAEAYRERYGLARGQPLRAPALLAQYRAAALARGLGDLGRAVLATQRHETGRPPGQPTRLATRIAASADRVGRQLGPLPPVARAIQAGERPRRPPRERRGRARGERAGGAKLTAEQVVAIRRRYAAGGVTQRTLAQEYGVSCALIAKIVQGHVWRHLE